MMVQKYHPSLNPNNPATLIPPPRVPHSTRVPPPDTRVIDRPRSIESNDVGKGGANHRHLTAAIQALIELQKAWLSPS